MLNQHEYFLNHSDGIPIEAGLDAKDEAEDGSEEDEGEEDEDEEGDRPRSALPVPSPLTTGFNVWNLIKNSLGRDLSSISLPGITSLLRNIANIDTLRDVVGKVVIKVCRDPICGSM